MRMKSVLLGFVAAGVIALSTGAAALPASAAPAPSLKVSSSTLTTRALSAPVGIVIPASPGAVICSGDLCIQRTSSIINNEATIEAWADNRPFHGHFELAGPDGVIANSADQDWYAGGAGHYFNNVARGGGYTITAWQGDPTIGYQNIGRVSFSI